MVEVMIVLVLVLSVAVDTSVYGQTIVRNGTTSTAPTPLWWTSSQTQGGIAGKTTMPPYNNRTTITRTASSDRNTAVKTRTTRDFVGPVQSTVRSTRRLISTGMSTKIQTNRPMSLSSKEPRTTPRRQNSTDLSRTSTKVPTTVRLTRSTISFGRTTTKPSTTKVLNSRTTLTESSTPQPYSTTTRRTIRRQSTDFNGRTTTKLLDSMKTSTESSTPLKTTRRRYTNDLNRRTTKISTTNFVNPTSSLTVSSTPLEPTSTTINFNRTRTTEGLGKSTSPAPSTTPLDPTRMIPTRWVWNFVNRHIYPNPRTEPRRCRRTSPSWVCDPSGLFTTEQVDELNDILTSISVESKCPCSDHCHHRKYGFVVTLAILYRYDPHPNETAPMTRHMRLSELRAGTCGEDTVVSFDFSRKLLNISTGLVAFQTLTDQLAKSLMEPFMEDITSPDAESNFNGIKEFLLVAKTVFTGTYNPPEMTDLERLFIAIGGSAGLMVVCSLFFCLILGTRAFWGRKKRNPSSDDSDDDEEDKYYDPKVEGTLIPFYHFVPEGTVGNRKRMGIIEMNNKIKTAKKNRNISTQEDDPEVYDDYDRFARVGRAARMWRMRARAAKKPPPKPPPPAKGNFRRSLTT